MATYSYQKQFEHLNYIQLSLLSDSVYDIDQSIYGTQLPGTLLYPLYSFPRVILLLFFSFLLIYGGFGVGVLKRAVEL